MTVGALAGVFPSRPPRRALTVAITLLALAFALAIGIYSSRGSAASGALSRIAQAAAIQVGQSVASIFSGRSPGERARGTLTNLKHKRSVALHERALPKIRPAPPVNQLASLVAPPPVAPAVVPPPVAPLFTPVTKGPAAGVPIAQSAPIIFPAMSPPPGGGFIVPPLTGQVTPPVTTTVTPPPPQAPAVPEPSSWMMMLVGFGMIGWMIRRGSGLVLN